MKKRLLSLLIILALILTGTMPVFAATDSTGFAGGSGTEGDPYLISTTAQLNLIRNDLAAHYKLISNIEFSDADFAVGGDFYNSSAGFQPIGNDESNAFSGVLDGNGHTIKNLTISVREAKNAVYVGLFGYNTGTIKNLGLENGNIYGKNTKQASEDYLYAYIGSIAGRNRGTIENCYNTGKVVGAAEKGTHYNTLVYVGGIAGNNDCDISSDISKISHCHNDGEIFISEAYDQFRIGGISGAGGSINDCYNSGTISTANDINGVAFIGGIAGNATDLRRCYNTGAITATSPNLMWGEAGGIVGRSEYAWYNEHIETSNCYNSGIITVSSALMAGGIAGLVYFNDIRNCFNIGNIDVTNSESAVSGGIFGYCRTRFIENCYNIGKVNENGSFGAIAGKMVSSGGIKNCYFLNNVSIGITECESEINQSTQCTAAQMKNQATFAGFDFDTIWTMNGNADYLFPELKAIDLQYKKATTSLTIKSQPQKTTYIQGESLDTAGLTVTANYDNGTAETITTYTITGDISTPGIKTITVTYDGKTATFDVKVLEKIPYIDVDAKTAWYYNSVQYAYNNGLMVGMSPNTFEPETTMNRAMMVTVLYRLEGTPAVSGENQFVDVASDQWYSDAITWAAQNNIVNGVSPTAFEPEETMTRAQMVTMLYRYAKFSQKDVSARSSLAAFADSASVPGWAQESMQWAVADGIIQGIDDNISPNGSATRAQVATVLMRYIEN